VFTYKTKIRLHDTDAAGIIFFANQLKIIHDAYEELLERSGLGFKTMLKRTDFFLPIVHAESSYKEPLFAGDKIVVSAKVKHIGNTSCSFEYTLKRGKTIVGTGKTVHVAIDQKTRQKIPLPSVLRKALSKY